MSTKLFFNGDIITMENELYAESIIVKDNRILKVGRKDELIKYADENVELIDLNRKTLMPSFIDAHSHFSGYAYSFLQVNLSNAASFNDISNLLKEYVEKNNLKPGEWVNANGYDHNYLKEKKHPTKELLDEAVPNNPVVIQHQSGHLGVFNSKALEVLGIDNKSNGFFEEEAFISNLKKLPLPDMASLEEVIKKAQDVYASYGITTLQEGIIISSLVDLMSLIINSKLLKLDLIGYVDIQNSQQITNRLNDCIKKYNNRFKVGGYKIILDGSPQAKTAWMLEPYKDDKNGYKGEPYCEDSKLIAKISQAINENMQVLVHCNGDAASAQYLRCYEKAKNEVNTKNNIRPVIIHAQLLTKKQLDDVKKLNMIPSFFVAHVYHWGDIHIKNFGKKRADEISIAKSAQNKGIMFTFHQDSPVIEPNMLETVWCAVNRITKEGVVLGEMERVSPLEALKAVTINAAYQYFEEDVKGSIKEGKLADLVILDKNPLKVNPMGIKDIKVLQTLKEGEVIYSC